MKPPPFVYYRSKTLSEALDLLSELGETAKPLAGGQNLVPMMNMRLARPAQLIDLNRIPELEYLNSEDGELHIGAITRQRALERSPIVTEHWPILSEATRYIGHVQIRNRGTVGVASFTPTQSGVPVAMTALDAVVVLRNCHSQRIVTLGDFFVDVMTTALQPDELLVEIRVPKPAERTGTAFQEISVDTETSPSWQWPQP